MFVDPRTQNFKTPDVFFKYINLVRTFWTDWFARPEPALSRACCAGPDLYSPIGKFQVTGRIKGRKFNVPTIHIDGHGPLRSTDVNLTWARPLPPTAGNPSQEQTASAEAARTGLSLPVSSSIQCSPDWAIGRTLVDPWPDLDLTYDLKLKLT